MMEKAEILVIDNIADDGIVLKALINNAFPDAFLVNALSEKKGIELCQTGKPDVILLNFDPSKPGSYETCRLLKADESTKNIPVIAVLASGANKEIRKKALEMGADAFLTKPIDELELIAQIRAMIRIKELEDHKLDENERLKKMVDERTGKLENSQKEMTKLLVDLKEEIEARRKSEKALRESEKRFRHISSSISDISYSCIIDSKGNSVINWLYGAIEKITGYTNEELFAMKCWGKIVSEEDFPVFKRYVLGVIPGTSEVCQLRLKKKDGSIVWIRASAECVIDDSSAGSPVLYGGLVDITESKHAEEALRESEYFFKESQRCGFIGSYKFDLITNIWTSSDVLNQIFGIDKTYHRDLMGWLSIIHPDDRGMMEKYMSQEVIAKRNLFDKEYRIVSKLDGEIRWLHGLGKLKFDDMGNIIELLGTVQDITDRKDTEEALRKNRERWESLFNNSPNAIAVYQPVDEGADFVFTDFNLTAQKTDNLNRDEVFGKRISELFPAAAELGLLDVFRNVWRTGKTEFVNSTFYKDNRIEGWRENIIYKLNTGEIVAIYYDVSDRTKAEIALRESEERFRSIFSVSPHAISISDIETGKMIEINEAYEKIFGYTREEVVGNTSTEVGIWIDKNDRNPLIDALQKEGFYNNIEIKFKTKNGSVIDCLVSGRKVLIKNMEYMLTLVNDVTHLKTTERAIKESEEKYRILFNDSPDSYLIITDGIFTDCNRVTEVMLRGDRTQIIGKTSFELSPEFQPDGRKSSEAAKEKIEYAFRNGKITFEWVHRRLDGTDFYAEVSIAPMQVSDKLTLFTTWHDITNRKNAEIALKERNTFIQTVLDNLPIGVALNTIDKGAAQYMNKKFEEIYGWPSEEIKDVADFFQNVYPEESYRKELIARIMTDIQSGDPLRMHWENCIITHKDGSEHFVNAVNIPLYGQNTMVSTVTDITVMKRAEQALVEREQLFRSLFNASPDAIVLIDPHHPTISWPIVDCNEASSRMNGYTQEEMIGQSIDILNENVEPSAERSNYINRLKQEGILHLQTYHRHKDGHVFPVEVSTSIITIGGREMVLGIDRDITERKLAEERMKESEERFRMVFENVFDGIVLYEEYPDLSQRKLIECNKQYAAMAGLTIEELLKYENTNALQISLEESSDAVRIESLYTRKAFRGSYSWIRPDGKDNIIEFIGMPVIWRGKSYTIGIDRDITERILAEEAIRVNELRLKRAELASKSGNWEYYFDSQMMVASEGAQKVYGVDGEKFNYGFIKNIPLVRYRPILDAALKNLIEKDIPYDIEFKIRAVDTGEIKDIHSVAFYDRKKGVLFGIIQDITEQKLAELKLKESEDRYRGFISQVSEGVYRFETDHPINIDLPVEEQIDLMYDYFYIEECNEAILKMYKLTDESEMLGKGLLDFHGSRQNPINRQSLRTFVESGYRIENALTVEENHKGQKIYISNNSLGIIENNQLVRLWGTQTDITDKIKADQVQQVLYSISNAALSPIELPELIELISQEIGKLLDSTNFYIAFYDEKTNLLSTIYERDEKDVFQTWPAENSITGYVIKHQESVLIKESEAQKFYDEKGILALGTPSKIWLGVPLTINSKTIGALVVQSYDDPEAYSEKDKQMLEFVSHQISISIERKKAEQELKAALLKAQESDRLKSAFLANMSHEIRTPLNSIIGFSDLLLDENFDHSQKTDFAKMINASGDGLLGIINDIMDISKMEAGQIKIFKQKFPVLQLVGDIQKEYSFKAAEKGIELRLDPRNPTVEIFMDNDQGRIRQILINLVSNAIKFTAKGFVEIGLSKVDDSVEFHVKDTGIGIPAEFHHYIFDRFRQVEGAETRKYGGNGLGLAISKNLVELMGGEIWIESEKGKGSTFYFAFPMSDVSGVE